MKPALVLAVVLAALAGCAHPDARPALDDDRFALVEYGMTRQDTLRLLGRPDATVRFAATDTEAWDYAYQDGWGYMANYSVTFGPEGRVVGKISQRLNDGGDHGSN